MVKYKCFDGTIVWVNKRLKYRPAGQCGVMVDEYGGIHLISYTTHVATIDPQGWLSINGLYSNTTRRHIGYFLREYAPLVPFTTAKKCYEKGQSINVYTTEVVKL